MRAWLGDHRVFVSSVIEGMEEDRQAAKAGVERAGALPVLFEDFGGRDSDPEAAYLSEVAASHVYIGLVGRRYGKIDRKTRRSATHAEYLQAETSGLRVCAWSNAGDDREASQQSFLDDLRVLYVVPAYRTPDDLAEQVHDRLTAIAAQDLLFWVKVGRALFRARVVQDDGRDLAMEAVVRDAGVVGYIQGLRSEFAREEMWCAWPGGVRNMLVEEVVSTTRSAPGTHLRLRLSASRRQMDVHSMADVGTQGYSADDITEVALREALLGEANPLQGGLQHLATFPDPFAPLRERPVSEEILRPVARLLLSEALVRSGRAQRLTQFRLGVSVAGNRRLVVGWLPPQRYTNVTVNERVIEGDAAL